MLVSGIFIGLPGLKSWLEPGVICNPIVDCEQQTSIEVPCLLIVTSWMRTSLVFLGLFEDRAYYFRGEIF